MHSLHALLVVAAAIALYTTEASAQSKAGDLPRISFATCSQPLSVPLETSISFAVAVTVKPDGTASNWRIGIGKGKNPRVEDEIIQLLKSCKFDVSENSTQTDPIEKRMNVYVSPAKNIEPAAKTVPTFQCKFFAAYPAAAMRNNEQGVAEVNVHVNSDATLAVVDIVTSTGSRWLDLASLPELDGCQFMPAVDEAGKAKSGTTSYKKVWRLG